ncbi:helix-turn-helix domain-containing protein [Clostridium tyrobutyricum]|uniref:helix-turn-helix domain-containing protein n=1 Tax=Clostridium tyrobutyricum TaxID=1519 RepID=UPI0020CE829D|nr:helix-turn-helix transcriptional regulator [Clostridium tyrobutyricum]
MKQSIKTELGRIIKSKRIEKNFTQNKVADATNISRNYLSDIENGRYVPSVDTLTKIARFLNMDLNFLLKMTEIQDKI